MQNVVVGLVTAQKRSMTCWFYNELDKMLRDHPSICPILGDMLSPVDSDIYSDANTSAKVTSKPRDWM